MIKSKLLSASALYLASSLCGGLVPAFAQSSISTAITTPTVTSTAGNVTVTNTGSVTLTSGTAITVDSDATVTLDGVINMSNGTVGTKGIFITGGRTSDVIIRSNITLTEDFTATDTNSDGIIDGPYARDSGRYALHSQGASPFKGNVNITNTSLFTIEGNTSYGVRFENLLDGSFIFDGTTNILGNNNTAISLENGVTGNVYLSGTATVRGENSGAAVLKGGFGGQVVIDGTYTATGYATTSPLSTEATAKLTPTNKANSAVLVDIGSSINKGLLIGGIPSDTSTTNTDEDGNGILDANQQVASLSQFGPQAALRIASASDITIGALQFASTAVSPPSVNYGLMINGTVQSSGLYEGKNTVALELGGLGGNVNIANGIGTNGFIGTAAILSDATAIRLASKTTTPRLDVRGNAISASNTTKTGQTSIALDIQSGASLPIVTIARSSGLGASSTGSTGKSIAIRDRSNSLSSLTINGILTSQITASDDNGDGIADTLINRPIALDLRDNSTAFTLSMIDDSTDAAITNPSITGDIFLGSGNDTIFANGGSLIGNINFGAGANSLTLENNAFLTGALTGSGTVNLGLTKGSAYFSSGTSLTISGLTVGAESTLGLSLDSDNPTTTILKGTGVARFDNGAKLLLRLDKLLSAPKTFSLIEADQINLGTLSLSVDSVNLPYIYSANLVNSTDMKKLTAEFKIKSRAELGSSENQYTALTPILVAADKNTSVRSAFLNRTTKSDFYSLYNQFLPDHSGEGILSLSHSVNSINNALSNLTYINEDQNQYWLNEQGFNQERAEDATLGFEATGFSFSGGREQALNSKNSLGIYLVYTTASPSDSFAIANETFSSTDLSIGGYWRHKTDKVRAWAFLGVGAAQFDSNRQLISSDINLVSKSKWNGSSLSAGAGLSYEQKYKLFSLIPQASLDYFRLKEDARLEEGGGDAFDLAIDERTSSLGNATALLKFRYDASQIKPELWLGVKAPIGTELGITKAHFKNGSTFSLNAGEFTEARMIGGFKVSMDSAYSYFALEAAFEKSDEYSDASIGLRTRFSF